MSRLRAAAGGGAFPQAGAGGGGDGAGAPDGHHEGEEYWCVHVRMICTGTLPLGKSIRTTRLVRRRSKVGRAGFPNGITERSSPGYVRERAHWPWALAASQTQTRPVAMPWVAASAGPDEPREPARASGGVLYPASPPYASTGDCDPTQLLRRMPGHIVRGGKVRAEPSSQGRRLMSTSCGRATVRIVGSMPHTKIVGCAGCCDPRAQPLRDAPPFPVLRVSDWRPRL